MKSTTKILDYKIASIDKRIKAIEDILDVRDENGLNEFERYFDSRYKCELNSTDALSEDNNYCKALEQMADYILGSEEVREDRKNGQQYRFYMDEKEFRRRTKKENVSIEGMTYKSKGQKGFEEGDSIIDFLRKKDNFLKPKIQKISKEDLSKSNRCGDILRDYKRYDEYLTHLLSLPQNGDGYKIRRIKGSVKDDMIYTKDSLNGVFGYKLRHEVKSVCKPDWNLFDWSNKDHVRYLIYVQREFDVDDDLALLSMDLDNLMMKCIDKGIISPKETELYMLIKKGYRNIEISKELNTNRQRITNLLSSITTKLCRESQKRLAQ